MHTRERQTALHGSRAGNIRDGAAGRGRENATGEETDSWAPAAQAAPEGVRGDGSSDSEEQENEAQDDPAPEGARAVEWERGDSKRSREERLLL